MEKLMKRVKKTFRYKIQVRHSLKVIARQICCGEVLLKIESNDLQWVA